MSVHAMQMREGVREDVSMLLFPGEPFIVCTFQMVRLVDMRNLLNFVNIPLDGFGEFNSTSLILYERLILSGFVPCSSSRSIFL